MKILCLPSWYPNKYDENSGIFIKKHIHLIAEDHDVSVLYIHADSKKTGRDLESEIKKEEKFTEYRFYYKRTNFIADTLNHLRCLIKGYKIIVKDTGKPQLCHLFVSYPAGLGGLYLKKVHKLNYVITEHWSGYTDYDGRFTNYNKITRRLIKSVFQNSIGVSTISTFLGENLKKQGLIRNYKIIPNVIVFPHKIEELNEKKESTISAISIASLDDFTKNITGIIDAVYHVCKKIPSFKLDIYGDGTDKEKLISYAGDMGLLNINIFFKGILPNDQLLLLYKKYHLFILNSNFETFSIATVEAIANGLPVVVTKCGGPEDFVNEINGILVERNNPSDLAKGILKIISNLNSYDRNRMSNEVKVRFNSENIKRSIVDFYSNSLN